MDARITQLKVEYEQYFMRVIRQEPAKLRGDIDKVVRRLSTTHITNTGDKFKFRTLVSKFNSYKQYWNRILRQIEEGTYTRHAEGGGGTASAPAAISKPKVKAKPSNGDGLNEVYSQYVEARKKCNQSVDGLSLEKLQKSIAVQKRKVEEKFGTGNVDIKVSIKNGTAKMSIIPKK